MAAAILGPNFLAKYPPMTMANGKQPLLEINWKIIYIFWDPGMSESKSNAQF